jgi:hypothetical protein
VSPWAAAIALILVGVFSALIATWISRTSFRKRFTEGQTRNEEALYRERAMSRRREEALREETKAADARTRVAMGLPLSAIAPMRGAQLARAVHTRVVGLASVDAAVVADESGLCWTRETSWLDNPLGATGGEALRIARGLGANVRELHFEMANAQHFVVRPLVSATPPLALVTASTSRPPSPFALDSAVSFAMLAAGEELRVDGTDPLTGSGLHTGANEPSAVADNLLRELSSARPGSHARALIVTMGDELLAADGEDGPSRDYALTTSRSLRGLMAYATNRTRVAVRRVDVSTMAGNIMTISPLGGSGRFSLIAVSAGTPIDTLAVDRLVGRLRRFLPSPLQTNPQVRRVA